MRSDRPVTSSKPVTTSVFGAAARHDTGASFGQTSKAAMEPVSCTRSLLGQRDVGDGGRLPVSRRDRDVLIGPEYLDRVAGLDAPRTASSDGRADSLRTGNGQFGCVFRERRIPLHIAAAPFSLSFSATAWSTQRRSPTSTASGSARSTINSALSRPD